MWSKPEFNARAFEEAIVETIDENVTAYIELNPAAIRWLRWLQDGIDDETVAVAEG